MTSELAVVIAGGGTGGHLYPGLAVAREIRRRVPNARVTFAGTERGLEARVVPREGFELDVIRSAGLKGKSFASRVRGFGLIPLGVVDAWRLLSRRRPSVVIGVGGYSSGPVVLTAALRGMATMVMEQNATPGLTNRILARVVRAAGVNFESTLSFFRGRGFVAGNPVRPEFWLPDPPRAAPATARVLVLGGSQGAHGINMAMMAAVPELTRRGVAFELVHQTGERDAAQVAGAYQQAGASARAAAFLDPVVTEMRAADLLVCRAGATTLAELAALGKPAILIPLPTATDDHQRKNADALAAAGAAIVVDERGLTGPALAGAIADLLSEPEKRAAMGTKMRTFARPDAATRIVDRVLELAAS